MRKLIAAPNPPSDPFARGPALLSGACLHESAIARELRVSAADKSGTSDRDVIPQKLQTCSCCSIVSAFLHFEGIRVGLMYSPQRKSDAAANPTADLREIRLRARDRAGLFYLPDIAAADAA